jgi:hypothetical protein
MLKKRILSPECTLRFALCTLHAGCAFFSILSAGSFGVSGADDFAGAAGASGAGTDIESVHWLVRPPVIETTAAVPPAASGATNDGPMASCTGNVSLPVRLAGGGVDAGQLAGNPGHRHLIPITTGPRVGR